MDRRLFRTDTKGISLGVKTFFGRTTEGAHLGWPLREAISLTDVWNIIMLIDHSDILEYFLILLIPRLTNSNFLLTRAILWISKGKGYEKWSPNGKCFDPLSSLRASSLRRSGGGAGKGRRASYYASGIWIPLLISLWFPFDWGVRFPPISAKRK